ncbi:MAG: hypothetical protein AB7D26_09790, partial [Marinobacterium sp.]
ETRCYDETKPESFVSRVFGRTLILLTWIQAFSFAAIYGTAVANRQPFTFKATKTARFLA